MRSNNLFKIMTFGSLVLGTLFLGSCMDDELNRPGGKISDGDLQGDNYILGAFFPQMTDMVVPGHKRITIRWMRFGW